MLMARIEIYRDGQKFIEICGDAHRVLQWEAQPGEELIDINTKTALMGFELRTLWMNLEEKK